MPLHLQLMALYKCRVMFLFLIFSSNDTLHHCKYISAATLSFFLFIHWVPLVTVLFATFKSSEWKLTFCLDTSVRRCELSQSSESVFSGWRSCHPSIPWLPGSVTRTSPVRIGQVDGNNGNNMFPLFPSTGPMSSGWMAVITVALVDDVLARPYRPSLSKRSPYRSRLPTPTEHNLRWVQMNLLRSSS